MNEEQPLKPESAQSLGWRVEGAQRGTRGLRMAVSSWQDNYYRRKTKESENFHVAGFSPRAS